MSCCYISDINKSGLLKRESCNCSEYGKKFGTTKVEYNYAKTFCLSNNHRNKCKCPLYI